MFDANPLLYKQDAGSKDDTKFSFSFGDWLSRSPSSLERMHYIDSDAPYQTEGTRRGSDIHDTLVEVKPIILV